MRLKQATRAASVAAIALAAAGAHAEAPYSFAATPGKLPKDVVPLQYAAHLVPELDTDTFRGSETVEIEVLHPTSAIVLNADNLQIDSARLSGKGWDQVSLAPAIDSKQQTVAFKPGRELAPGRYRLALEFRGKINREPRGMFWMKYKANGVEKKMIATTMEPSDARRMLPTWDEPSFRAKFKLTVDLPASFKAYSNTPIEKQQKIAGGKERVTFAATPKMSSYLVVLVAGELERLSAKQDGVDLGVVTTEGKQASAVVPLAVTKDVLHYYNNYFGVPYPLAKLDQIAIPGGFNGAMENWGGIVYNESGLLYNPATSPDSVKKLTFIVTAHEMAHQWFGNLVTMAWWDNLWLNEGFASWMSAKAEDHLHPEWRPWLDAIVEREGILNSDSRKTTHPIQTPIANEEQAANAFDEITYYKGQAFLRMLETYLGEDAFRRGIRNYIANHQYSNTTTADLWMALEKASGKPVGKLASDWTMQPGFPLISVSQSCENGKRKVTLSQQQFRMDEPATEKRLWHVPVQVGTVGGKAWYTLLSGPSTTLSLAGCEGTLVVDPASVGFFRVQYDKASFDALAAQAPKLPDATRLKLLTDSWTMVEAGRAPLAGYLKLVSEYRNEPRKAVWDSILGSLNTLDTLARGEPQRQQVRHFVTGFVQPKFDQLGWDEKPGESDEDRNLRAQLAATLARAGDKTAIAHARTLLARYLEDPKSVSPALVDFAVGISGRYADAATYDTLLKRMMDATSDEDRRRFALALMSVEDPVLAGRTLQLALSPQLPPHLTSFLVPVVAREHPDQAWAFAVQHKDQLIKDQDAIGRNRAFPAVVEGSSNPADAQKLEEYVGKNFGPEAVAEAKRIANSIRIRAAQKQRLLPQVQAAMK